MLKKSMFVLLAFLLVSGVFVPAALAEEPIKITVLNYFDLTSPGAEREINEVWYEFSVRNPHIIVEREDLFLEPFHQKTEAYAAADRLPDVIYSGVGGRSTSLHTLGLVRISDRFWATMQNTIKKPCWLPSSRLLGRITPDHDLQSRPLCEPRSP